MQNKKVHTFNVDMNALRGDEIGAVLSHATCPIEAQIFPPLIGDVVIVRDEEGDRWEATVTAVDGDWLGVEIDWDSILPAAPFIEDHPAPALMKSLTLRSGGNDHAPATVGYESRLAASR